MINWKLAKQLKDAGFPQDPTMEVGGGCDGQMDKVGFYFVSPPESCGAVGLLSEVELEKLRKEKPNHIVIKIPTLEELIAACGINRFLSLWQELNDESEKAGLWGAMVQLNDAVFGKTSEEAVANLWLRSWN